MSEWTDLQRRQSDDLVSRFWPKIEQAENIFDGEVAAAKADLRRGCTVLDPKHGKLFSGTKCKPHRTYRWLFSRAVSKVSRARKTAYAWYDTQFKRIKQGTYDLDSVTAAPITLDVRAWVHTASGRWRRATDWAGPYWVSRVNLRLPTSSKLGHIQVFGSPSRGSLPVELQGRTFTFDPVGRLRWGNAHRLSGVDMDTLLELWPGIDR